ncbi:MAG: HTH-like domain [Bacteroidota bacterium]
MKFIRLNDSYAELDKQIKTVFEKSRRAYGSPRVLEQLKVSFAEKSVSKATVARRMQTLGLMARPKQKYVNTTDLSPSASIP